MCCRPWGELAPLRRWRRGSSRLYAWQRRHLRLVVVCADPVEALESAFHAAMDDHFLTVGALEDADGLHEPFAGAGAVARALGIHMA